jgi:hypothetical protein
MQDTTECRAWTLEDRIKKLEAVNKRLAKINLEKEALTAEIIACLGHKKDGQTTYEVSEWKVTVKTPMILSLDTKAYKSGAVYLDEAFNPIQEQVSYKVDRKKFELYMETAPASVRESLTELVTLKPGKASVSVMMRC